MSADAALELAAFAIEAAREAGAVEADASCSIARRFSCEARDREVTKLEQSTGRGVMLRVFGGGPGGLRRATLTTSDLTREGLRTFARRAVDASRDVAPDEFAGLPDANRGLFDDAGLDLESADVAARSDEAKLDDVLALERFVRAQDSRIDNSNGSHAGDAVAYTAFANSNGVRAGYASTSASRGTSPVARDGEDKRTASYGTAARSWAGCDDVETVGRMAAQRTVAMCGARKLATQRLPVIFERDIAAAVLGDLFAALCANNVAIGNSFLAGRIGDRIGSDLVTIVDDGRLPAGLGTSPFDTEGVPTQRTTLFEAGTLRSFVYDTYYARKLGARSTGNAAGGGIGPNNVYLAAGKMTLPELIGSTRHGVLVLETIGFATEMATGIYSRGAHGIMIESGELTHPVEGFTIASTFPEMLAGLDAAADDLRFDSTIVSPSFRIAEMTISGE